MAFAGGAFVAVVAAQLHGPRVEVGVLVICALVCAVTDYLTGYVYDAVIGSCAALVAIIALLEGRLPDAAWGALLGGLAMGAIHVLTARRGLGLGDVKLAAAFGAGLGLYGTLVALCVAWICGGIAAVVLLSIGRASAKTRLPFGPFLSLGCLVALGWGA